MKNIIRNFYNAFANLDAEEMVESYHPQVQFEDPAFGKLTGDKAKNMWRMLCESQKGKDFRIEFSDIEFEDQIGRVHWEAYYTFRKTRRKVHNIINAEFTFLDGKIITHKDTFDLYRWSKQAMGLNGYLIGWSSFFRNKLQAQTNKLLSDFEKSRKSS
jgi:limonene-1,2-epoxide hydrolase